MELTVSQWTPDGGWDTPLPAVDGPQTLVLAFGASGLIDDPAVLDELSATYPTSVVMGCSTAGEIRGDTVADDTLTVAVSRFATTRLRLVQGNVADPAASHQAGLELAKRMADGADDLRAMFVLSDGLHVNGSGLVEGLVEGSGGRVTITGGLAGDGDRFDRSWVLVDGAARSNAVTAVGLFGPDVCVGHGSRGGWDIFGPERRITRAEGNVLYELDGQPALELYKNYLGNRAEGLPATALLFPLALRVPGTEARSVVRTILAVDEATQTMTFAGDVPTGSSAQLMRANFDRLVDGAHGAAFAAETVSSGPVLALAISCVGRRLVLGQRTEEELEAAIAGLPDTATLVGFYSYGEISPLAAGTCDLHNQTMTITTISEELRENPTEA